MAERAGEEPTDPWLLAVEAQRTAVEHFANTLAWAIGKHGRAPAVGATYAEILGSVSRDPASYTGVLVMALLMLAEGSYGPRPSLGGEMPAEDVERLRCGLISTHPDQDGEKCDQRAEIHLLVRCREHGNTGGLLACLRHYPVAVASGELVMEHKVGRWCGLPGAYFDQDHNECQVDDSGIEPPDQSGGK